ncbi:GNAT family N-acetyltransferase [Chromobacterium sp. IIBBL 290-4]|uniref:GNAT family N-acetyltransferase n=1 Tax=Chromobacterium sp. IIBBL 290-4 TaxID=2953890 RepID=UPI0020B7A56D|nr:GNAT family N-acetyltransferase [Chromobacterium sp. IIBBL 290-4]UTH75941.1 GNAT family N-acetyltransferase [Chromobacterium sp. IIBBL 290-4]
MSNHPPDQIFRTERLAVRRWRDADMDALSAVCGDAQTMRWVGDGQTLARADCRRWLEATRRHYAARGYGMFAVEDGLSGELLGFCGLTHPDGQAEPELKYAFLPAHWGRGLASEAAAAMIAHAAAQWGLRHIIATVAEAHPASQRVLLKAGMALGESRREADGSRTLRFHWRARQDAPASAAGPRAADKRRFNVYGRILAVERREGGWRAFWAGGDGKRRPAGFIIPNDLAAGDLTQYLEDLFHENATPRNGEVRALD